MNEVMTKTIADADFLFRGIRELHKMSLLNEYRYGGLEILFSDLLPKVNEIRNRLNLIQSTCKPFGDNAEE